MLALDIVTVSIQVNFCATIMAALAFSSKQKIYRPKKKKKKKSVSEIRQGFHSAG